MKTGTQAGESEASELEDGPPVVAPKLRTTWTIEIHLELPSDMTCRVHPTTYNQVEELLAGRGPVFRIAPDSVDVAFGVEAREGAEALAEANKLAPAILDLLDPARETVVNLSMSEHVAGQPSDYVGMGEVATIMGVSKQRIYQLARRKDFPEPAFRLKATPVWKAADIYKFRRFR